MKSKNIFKQIMPLAIVLIPLNSTSLDLTSIITLYHLTNTHIL